MSIIKLLAQGNFIMFNKPLARKIGIDEAILIGSLCSIQSLNENQEFYCEQSKLIDDTCLTEYRLRNATKTLKDKNIISITKKGLPAKNYYKVNEEVINSYLTTSGTKFDTTGSIKSDTTINNSYIYNSYINKNKEKEIYLYSGAKAEPCTNTNSDFENNTRFLPTEHINNISRDSELNEMHYQDENLSEETTAHSKTSKEPKHKYGVYKNILLTDRELEKLKEEFPNWQEVIDYVDEAIEMKGYKYKSHYLAIRKWFKDKSRANSLGSGLNKKVKDTSTIDENGVISL